MLNTEDDMTTVSPALAELFQKIQEQDQIIANLNEKLNSELKENDMIQQNITKEMAMKNERLQSELKNITKELKYIQGTLGYRNIF